MPGHEWLLLYVAFGSHAARTASFTKSMDIVVISFVFWPILALLGAAEAIGSRESNWWK